VNNIFIAMKDKIFRCFILRTTFHKTCHFSNGQYCIRKWTAEETGI